MHQILIDQLLEDFYGTQHLGCILRARSSVVEHILHTDGVAGSNPAARTISSSWTALDIDRQTGPIA